MIVNPFNFETPADHWSFTDRDDVLPSLREIPASKKRRVLVYGRRRMGKTSVIKHAARLEKAPFLFVDLSTASDLREVSKKLLAAAPLPKKGPVRRLLELAQKYVKVVKIEGGSFKLSAEMREPGEETFENVLNFLDAAATLADQCWTVCLDEFQDIRILGGERADWRIRGVIQHHQTISYIFSGSDHRLLRWMTEPGAAFYKQLQTVTIDAIEPALLGAWIDERTRRGGLPDVHFGAEVVATAGPCTGDIVRLAKTVFDLTASQVKGDVIATAFDAIALKYLHPEFVQIWRPLAHAQRLMLRAIAAGLRPLAGETLDAYAIKGPSTGSTAIEALIDRQILIRVDDRLLFDSPFFRRWVEANAGPAG